MNKKRPFLKLAIQKIESLFYKNKDNPVILSDIKNELNHRKTSKAKALKDDVNKASESIDKSDILQQAENNSELLLKSISLVDFVKDYEVPVRLRNAIIAEADFIEFNSIYDFITSSKENQQHLNRLPKLEERGIKTSNPKILAVAESNYRVCNY